MAPVNTVIFCVVFLGSALKVLSKKPDNLHPEVEEMVDSLHETCVNKIGITDDDVENYEISNKDPKMMCYMNCLMLEAGWIDADGKLDYDQMKEHGSHHSIKDLLMPIIDQCQNIEDGSQECEKAYNFNRCMANAAPDHYFLP